MKTRLGFTGQLQGIGETRYLDTEGYPKITARAVVRKKRIGLRIKKSNIEEHRADALAPSAEEGRGKLRKATGSRKQAENRRYPNGETRRTKVRHAEMNT